VSSRKKKLGFTELCKRQYQAEVVWLRESYHMTHTKNGAMESQWLCQLTTPIKCKGLYTPVEFFNTLPWPNYFAGGAKSFGKLLEFCHPFCTPGKIVQPRQ